MSRDRERKTERFSEEIGLREAEREREIGVSSGCPVAAWLHHLFLFVASHAIFMR